MKETLETQGSQLDGWNFDRKTGEESRKSFLDI
jgi:hypothetical protein